MYNGRTNMSNEVYDTLLDSYGELVFKEAVPMLQEARNSTETRSSLVGRKSSKVGRAYMAAAHEILRRNAE